MLSLFTRLPRGSLAISPKCCGLLWKSVTNTNTKMIHASPTYSQQVKVKKSHKDYKHYMRSSYSLIHHYYKDLGTLKDAKDFVKEFPNVKSVARPRLEQLIQLLKDDGYNWTEVELFKRVLLISPTQYTQRSQLLQSLLLTQPSLFQILWMNTVMDGTIKSLRENPKSIFKSDPIELLIASTTDLNLPPSTVQGARDLAASDDSVTMRDLLYYFIKHYLAQRFTVDVEVVGSFLQTVQITTLMKPLHYFPKICDLFINDLGLTFSEVQKHPQLFHLDPDNTKEFVKKYPSIGGTPTKEVAKKIPKLLMLPAPQLDAWLKLLHKHQVDKFACTLHTRALFKTDQFSKVEERLQILKRCAEWEVIVVSDKLFKFLRSQGCIKRLLNITESGSSVPSISSVVNPSQCSKAHKYRRATQEVVLYIATALGLPVEEMKDVLAEHIYTSFGINNTKIVFRLLIDYGFTREQVVLGAMVLNFEAAVVEQVLKDLHTRPEAQPFAEWMENPFVLHLLTYCITKDFPHLILPIRKYFPA